MSSGNIWVFGEHTAGSLTTTTSELITAAASFSSKVTVFVAGQVDDSIVATAGRFGADDVVFVADVADRLVGTAVASALVSEVASAGAPKAIFFGATYEGRDCAARTSAKLGASVLTNVVNIVEEGDRLLAEHAIFGGTEIATSSFSAKSNCLFVIRAKSFPLNENPKSATSREVSVGDIGTAGRARVTASNVEERKGPKLDEAAIVVSGGRGLGKAESYQMVEDLALVLKGAPGASRAIVDAGWVPYAYQVGQTGKTVKPTVYIACGISGATQHMVGMKGAKNIIAINKDQEAPIFSIADLGIVGDVHKVLPALIEALKAR
jgi:electron transfer flavoprotein alpha subunit